MPFRHTPTVERLTEVILLISKREKTETDAMDLLHKFRYKCIYIYALIDKYLYMYIYTYIYIYMYVYVYILLCVSAISVLMYIYIYIYI
jgi:hypothetical protein